MSDCGNCECADKTKYVGEENGHGLVIVETESYMDTVVMDAPAAEHSGKGKCRCGDSCPCVNCTCGCGL